MKKHKLIWFYIFTLVFTVILGGIGGTLLDESNYSHYAIMLTMTQSSPTLGLFLICVFSKNFIAFKGIKWYIAPKKLIWLLSATIIPAILIVGSAVILSVTGTAYVTGAYNSFTALLIVIIASVLGATGEEIGWRGFMLPVLHKKHNLLISSIITGVLWGVWHFGKIQLFGITGYLLFTLLCVEFTILMAWILIKANRSIIPMIVFHSLINIFSVLFLNEREGIAFYIAACIIGCVLCGIIILTNKTLFFTQTIDKN